MFRNIRNFLAGKRVQNFSTLLIKNQALQNRLNNEYVVHFAKFSKFGILMFSNGFREKIKG